MKNIKEKDVIMFPYFIIASEKKYFEVPEKILNPTVVIEISTISGKKIQLN